MKSIRKTAGFTLIEMIVSLALFSVVVTISVGSLLILIASNRQLQDEQAVLANLSFALDSMTREIRTGSAYVATSWTSQTVGGPDNPYNPANNLDATVSLTDVRDDSDGRRRDGSGEPFQEGVVHGISFVEGGDSITGSGNDRIIYFHDANDSTLYRRIGNGIPQRITSDGVEIVDADFFVTGSAGLDAGEDTQPSVTIYLEAQVAGASNPKTYPVQTTVVQRTLDL